MKTVGSILIWAALVIAAIFGPNLDVQVSGTAVCLLAIGVVVAALGGFRGARSVGALSWLALILAGWLCWLALRSPVPDLGRADAILILGGSLGCLWAASLASRRTILLGFVLLCVLAAVSLGICVIQVTGRPEFHALGGTRPTPEHASGFYGHYNYFANFLLGILFPLLGLGLMGRRRPAIRAGWLFGAVIVVAGILLSQSRGALVGLAAGGVVFAVMALIDWRRRYNLPGGLVALIAVVALPALGAGGFWVARKALAERSFGNSSALEHDSGRLEFAAMALEQASQHPFTGSGSRSFEYEALAHWDVRELWIGSSDINFVHNEYLQAASDYGWPALALIVVLVAGVLFKGAVTVSLKPVDRDVRPADPALTAGAMAGLIAMAAQASFSFVFHLLPNVLLASMLLGIVAGQPWPLARSRGADSRFSLAAVILILLSATSLIWFWRDAAAVPKMLGEGTPVERLARAAGVRPDFQLYRRLGDVHLSLTADSDLAGMNAALEGASVAYGAAVERHPFDVETAVNLAKVLDRLGRFDEAAAIYQRIIPLADPREGFYRTRFYHGRHAYLRALDWLQQGDSEAALDWLVKARERIEVSRKLYFFGPASTEARLLTAVNDLLARGIFTRGHKLYLEGREAWYARRPEEALALLLDAREAMMQSRSVVRFENASEPAAVLKDVESLIELLEGAGIKPEANGE